MTWTARQHCCTYNCPLECNAKPVWEVANSMNVVRWVSEAFITSSCTGMIIPRSVTHYTVDREGGGLAKWTSRMVGGSCLTESRLPCSLETRHDICTPVGRPSGHPLASVRSEIDLQTKLMSWLQTGRIHASDRRRSGQSVTDE